MSRYVDLDDLSKRLFALCDDMKKKGFYYLSVLDLECIAQRINELPIADVASMEVFEQVKTESVPVVRCKDCIYGEFDDPDFPDTVLCRHNVRHYNGDEWNGRNHFCSYGVHAKKGDKKDE